MNKKKKRIVIIGGLCFLISLIKISIPPFLLKPQDLHCELAATVIDSKRSLWYYKPLCDSLVISDSLRNIRFKVLDAYAYKGRYFEKAYFQFYLPWAEIVNFDSLYYWDISFEGMDLRGIKNNQKGLFFSVSDTAKSLVHRSEVGWDNIEKNTSHYGVRIRPTLPDTLFFTVWGYPELYVDKKTYRSLPEDERYKIIDKARSLRETKTVLGEIILVKSDSIIVKSKFKENETKLFIKNMYDL